MSESDKGGLSNLMHEERHFEPPAEFAEHANVTAEVYAEADRDRLAFWAKQAERLDLGRAVGPRSSTGATRRSPSGSSAASSTRRTTASTGTSRPATATRSPTTGSASPRTTPATSPTPSSRTRSARPPTRSIELGVKAGDRVAIYMPMIPETVVAMLACARIGAPHTVVFGGFSSDALVDRIQDCDARVVITADGGYRRGSAAAPQAGRRRGAASRCPRGAQRARGHAAPGRTSAGTRAATCGGTTWSAGEHRARARGLRRRAPALRHVHLRHDRQAQGHPAHDRRLPGRHVVHALGGLRPQADDRRLLVQPPTSAG